MAKKIFYYPIYGSSIFFSEPNRIVILNATNNVLIIDSLTGDTVVKLPDNVSLIFGCEYEHDSNCLIIKWSTQRNYVIASMDAVTGKEIKRLKKFISPQKHYIFHQMEKKSLKIARELSDSRK